ncbi:MAG: FAD-dependent oxidoreductase [Hyphomicrobiales bacterium]|nr:FAD-dependent oxidoreductase [Hyphomicrobiales bacterium]
MKTIAAIEAFADRYDLAIVGAGPAGLAAASLAVAHGVDVVVLDENASPGGQIYRAVTSTPMTRREILGEDYWRGVELVQEFSGSASSYAPSTTVWNVARGLDGESLGQDFEIGVSLCGKARLLRAKEVILATGAQERPFPIPGWTLPGVMTAGAAQIALKSSGLVPDGRLVLAGTGPLLYLVAAQLIEAGASIRALLDTTPRANWMSALTANPGFLASPYLAKGLALLRMLHRRLDVVGGITALRAEGQKRLNRVAFERAGLRTDLDCDLLLLHQGIVPSINLSNAIGCAHDWDDVQLAFRPQVDAWFASTVQGVAIAGDSAGIAGGESAAARGRIAALGAAFRLERIGAGQRDRDAAPLRAELALLARGRRFLDVFHRPAKAFRVPSDDATLVCRCEEVSAKTIRETVVLGACGPNQMKAFTRCGMGPCQGRLCGLTVTEMIADARAVSPAEVGYYRLRPPVKPVTLAEIAALPQTPDAEKAVAR